MKRETILTLILFGSIWGLSESVLGNALYAGGVPYASVYLSVIAVAVLALARVFVPRGGSSSLMALVAVAYKSMAMYTAFLGSAFFVCHLLAILVLGGVFDATFTLLERRGWCRTVHRAVAGFALAYVGFAAFGLLITYAFGHPYWIGEGLGKIANYVATRGTITACVSAFLVPGL